VTSPDLQRHAAASRRGGHTQARRIARLPHHGAPPPRARVATPARPLRARAATSYKRVLICPDTPVDLRTWSHCQPVASRGLIAAPSPIASHTCHHGATPVARSIMPGRNPSRLRHRRAPPLHRSTRLVHGIEPRHSTAGPLRPRRFAYARARRRNQGHGFASAPPQEPHHSACSDHRATPLRARGYARPRRFARPAHRTQLHCGVPRALAEFCRFACSDHQPSHAASTRAGPQLASSLTPGPSRRATSLHAPPHRRAAPLRVPGPSRRTRRLHAPTPPPRHVASRVWSIAPSTLLHARGHGQRRSSTRPTAASSRIASRPEHSLNPAASRTSTTTPSCAALRPILARAVLRPSPSPHPSGLCARRPASSAAVTGHPASAGSPLII